MPTARELLEQADALMRRNRGGPGVGPPTGQVAPLQRPDPPLPSPDHRVPGPADDFPVLTDAVPPPSIDTATTGPAEALAGSVQAPSASTAPADLDDVPLLTDAVEEIEAPSILDVPEGEDATWHPAQEASPLAAPASSASAQAAPMARTHAEAPASTGDAAGVESIDIAPPADHEEAGERARTTAGALGDDAAADEAATDDDVVLREVVHVRDDVPPRGGAGIAYELPASAHAHRADAEGVAADDGVEAGDGGASALDFDDDLPAPTIAPDGASPSATTAAHAAPAAVAGARVAAGDEARWHALAEEIRMQVLQRIDLFTDTGLRDQLAERLRPVVDRASADLVATINQHVGVILRAYVSEAIEREIERWRSQGR